jgi:predicted NBD/HSP70 family sugar kinase
VERDALALEVASAVLMNHALGIANLVLLFDPQLVVIGWETLTLPAAYKARMQILDSMPELDIPRAVCQQLARRGVTPPKFVHAALDPEVVMLGAAALLVDEFLRTPPAVEA